MKNVINWGIFALLTLIWGSSFILMKEGLVKLTAYQVAALRIFSAGMVLLPIGIRQFEQIPKDKILPIIASALMGSFIPAFLFCVAEEHINSSLAGIVNALSPLFSILIGVLFYKMQASPQKIGAVLIGFLGLCLLFISKDGFKIDNQSIYALLIVIATVGYGWSGNYIAHHLKGVGSVNIAAIAFSFLAIPAGIILIWTGYFQGDWSDGQFMSKSFSSCFGCFRNGIGTDFILYFASQNKCYFDIYGHLYHSICRHFVGHLLRRNDYVYANWVLGFDIIGRLFCKSKVGENVT